MNAELATGLREALIVMVDLVYQIGAAERK